MLCVAAVLVSLTLPAPNFERVFGATVGTSNPAILTNTFGPGKGEVRKYAYKSKNGVVTYARDDGWNWWYWPEANANVQCYWGPAYPKAKRKIVHITICDAFKRDAKSMIHPDAKTADWLVGIKIGMPKVQAIRRFEKLFGKPGAVGYEYRWGKPNTTLSVLFEYDRLSEIIVCIR